jgi:hypothetical protein
MHSPETWRDLLGRIIKNSHERQRIASTLNIHPMTLVRWVTKEATPRSQNLRRLLEILPEHRERLLSLIEEEFPDISLYPTQAVSSRPESASIPSEFYTRVLHTKAYLPEHLRYASLCELILQQALGQLDPHRVGMAVIVARCMPPSSHGKVRSLRESQGQGTPPWPMNLEPYGVFLGAESLAGVSIISGHLQVNQQLSQSRHLAAGYRGRWEESAAAAPILDAGRIAGVLLVSSALPDYFTPPCCALIEQYAELIAVAFASEDFCELERIDLGIMPLEEEQLPFLSRFRQRVNKLMIKTAREGQPLTITQAEQPIWQQLEAELLELREH